jgi:hypothetical protein
MNSISDADAKGDNLAQCCLLLPFQHLIFSSLLFYKKQPTAACGM